MSRCCGCAGWGPHFCRLIGKTVTEIRIAEETLELGTADGVLRYTVLGECCSSSYFHDFIGVEKLLSGPLVGAEEIENVKGKTAANPYGNEIEFYGYKFISDHPLFGEVTSAVAFRNESNGYYGGWMSGGEDLYESFALGEDARITTDVLEVTGSGVGGE